MKKNFLILTGGTGGHVIPAQNLSNYLYSKNINCKIIVDKRGSKYLDNSKSKINIINSSNLSGNLFFKISGIFALLSGFIQSIIIIILFKPSIVISFGSYASFAPMLCSTILKPVFKIKIFIHEQNSIIGRTNLFFMNFTDKLFLNFNILSKINHKYQKKTFIVGSPEKFLLKKAIKKDKNINKQFTITILGGSQGSEFISNFSLELIKKMDEENIINADYIFQCPKKMIKKVSDDLKKSKSKIVVKEYFFNLDDILEKTSIAISRAGAGSVGDLIDFKIPSILIPLPTSKDNHQFHNASILAKHELAIIFDQDNYNLNYAKNYIYEFYNNKKKLELINNKFDKIKVKNSNSLIYNLITNEK